MRTAGTKQVEEGTKETVNSNWYLELIFRSSRGLSGWNKLHWTASTNRSSGRNCGSWNRAKAEPVEWQGRQGVRTLKLQSVAEERWQQVMMQPMADNRDRQQQEGQMVWWKPTNVAPVELKDHRSFVKQEAASVEFLLLGSNAPDSNTSRWRWRPMSMCTTQQSSFHTRRRRGDALKWQIVC